ncbi:MAG TPA: hypothetical protein PLM22_07975 [Candidatus Sabulitectum sp.]|nr:hypothetical protein [Candidatus Sabulitectum sp.]HPR22703.1 hypothetical protein [Candidatus Sabulitectum sp.]
MGKRENPLIRDRDTGSMLELLMVSAVVTIIVSRAFLAAAGYPSISPGNLHIAHMLWGGLLMLAALVMVLRYWNPSVRRFASFTGGVGFGLFVDELGKFITSDNDYFYRPAIAVIYVVFILMFLLFRSFARRSPLSAEEQRVNSAIRSHLGDMLDTTSRILTWYDRLRKYTWRTVNRLLSLPGFIHSLMVIFIFLNLAQPAVAFGLLSPGWIPFSDVSGISMAGVTASGILVIVGLFMLKGSLLSAFHWFRRAVLVNIFVTQVFLFYASQMTAVFGLGLNLLFYAGIDSLIKERQAGNDDEPGTSLE